MKKPAVQKSYGRTSTSFHQLAGGFEHEGVGRHEALHETEQSAGKSGIEGRNDKDGELVAVDIMADGGGS